MEPVNKVYAYITRRDQLLVFRHVDFPEVGIQVPGGTVEVGEALQVAIMREAYEKTGLESLHLVSYLGSHEWQFSAAGHEELHLRYFYHLVCGEEAPAPWQHYERHPSDGSPAPILFEFSWLPLLEAKETLNPYYVAGLDSLRGNLDRTGARSPR